MSILSYKDLIVWQRSIILVKDIYDITREFPNRERYGLAAQMQGAVVAIPSNIAEGYTRSHRKEYIQFLSIAYASAAELQTQLVIAEQLYDSPNYTKLSSNLEEILKMLYVLIRKLKSK